MFRQIIRRRVGTLSVLAFVLMLGALLLSGFGHSKSKSVALAPPPEVTVAQVIHRPLREWQEFSGRLQAVNNVEVRPRVSGYIDSVAFVDGARVKKGQLLFQIDPRPFQAEVDRLVSERNRSLSDLQLAEANQARAERLIGAHAISREEYERQVAALSSAQGALGSVDASLKEARLNREFTEVRAAIDGHVSRAIVTAGNLVTSASVLTTLVSDDPVYVYFDADEQTYLKFEKAERDAGHPNEAAAAVYVGLTDEQGYPHEGRLDFIDNHVDPATGTIRARASVANPDGRYTPGLFARVRLVGGEDQDGVLIEDRAVGTDLSKKFVLTLAADHRVEYRLIELGPEIDGLRVVKQGLKPGEIVVVNGMQHVRPGQVTAPTLVSMSGDGSGLSQVAADQSQPPKSPAQARYVAASSH